MKSYTETKLVWILITPAVISLIIVIVYPMLSCILTSFLDYRSSFFPPHPFVGFLNYQRAFFKDTYFWSAVVNTAIWTVGSLGIGFASSLGIALLLNQRVRGISIFRAMVFLSWSIPAVIAAITWQSFYDPFFGLFNYIFRRIRLIDQNIAWLGNPSTVLPALMALMIWKYNPFLIIGLLAGLQAIPKELYEAASIDGANTWHRFIYITLPSLKNIILILLVLNSLWRANHFDIVWFLTKGGPGHASDLLATYAYKQAFGALDFGYGSAIAIITMLFLAGFCFIFVRAQERSM